MQDKVSEYGGAPLDRLVLRKDPVGARKGRVTVSLGRRKSEKVFQIGRRLLQEPCRAATVIRDGVEINIDGEEGLRIDARQAPAVNM